MSTDVKYRFKIFGPFPVWRSLGKSKNRINTEDVKAFWKNVDPKESRFEGRLSEAGGIYVFGLRAGEKDPGKPWYIGKAVKQNFHDECFTPHKREHYHDVMEARGNRQKQPIMYFIARCQPSHGRFARIPSKTNHQIENAIEYLETSFISLGVQRNKNLNNVANARLMSNLSVEGVRKSQRRGRREPWVTEFRKMFGITGPNAF